MTIQEAKDHAAKEWNTAFDYRTLRNGVQVGNIAMLHLDGVNDRAIELYATQFQSPQETNAGELFEEAEVLMERLLPPKKYGESYSAEALYNILKELRDLALTRQSPAVESKSEGMYSELDMIDFAFKAFMAASEPDWRKPKDFKEWLKTRQPLPLPPK